MSFRVDDVKLRHGSVDVLVQQLGYAYSDVDHDDDGGTMNGVVMLADDSDKSLCETHGSYYYAAGVKHMWTSGTQYVVHDGADDDSLNDVLTS